MKKLYKKGTVYPTPPFSDQLLSFLPATILTLTVGLSPDDKEVLAYLISCSSSTNFSNNHRKATQKTTTSAAAAPSGGSKVDADHPPSFNCYCFRCYMNYWAKWDSSPNRQLIHEVIDAFEESLLMQNKKDKSKKERRKGKSVRESGQSSELKKSGLSLIKDDFDESNSASVSTSAGGESGGGEAEEDDVKEEELENGSVTKIVSFLGEKIWGIWR